MRSVRTKVRQVDPSCKSLSNVFQFFNVGAETIGKFDIDFIDAADVKAVRDSSGLSFSLNPGESKEQLFVFAVRIVFPSEKG
jgi:hypothetical protein